MLQHCIYAFVADLLYFGCSGITFVSTESVFGAQVAASMHQASQGAVCKHQEGLHKG